MEVHLEINGAPVSVREGSTIMEAANKLGAYVPHFCYHEKLSVAANCRMCMVDVEKSPKALPACATPAVDGMVVRTNSAAAKRAQKAVMEFLLINHPLDCPICDQGGECQLQDLAVGYGASGSRYREEKRVVFEKNLGPLIATDMTRCIHCTRCARFGREIAGVMELGMVGRGEHAEIMPFIERTVDSELSGNMIDICPVGALTSKPFRYTARPWELTSREAIASHDSWGSHLTAQTKGDAVKRVLPSRAPAVKEHWISDRDRFSYEGLSAPDRALSPMSRERGGRTLQEAAWRPAAERLAAELRKAASGGGGVGFFVSPRATCEEAFLARRIADHLGCENIDCRLGRRDFSGPDIGGLGTPFADLKGARAALFVGAEPAREAPLLTSYLRQRAAGKSYLSLSPVDIGRSLPLRHGVFAPPEQLAALMVGLTLALDGEPPDGWTAAGGMPLFSGRSSGDALRAMAETLRKAGDKSVIWLGDIARSAPQYGVIAEMARRLAALLGGRVGALDDGANGVGARLAGALPGAEGMDVAAMLRADLRAIVMFRCEPADFCESALARRAIGAADFVGALTSFVGEDLRDATIVLPVTDFCETDGTYVNGQGEEARFAAAVRPPGKARQGWRVLRYLGEALGAPGFDFDDLPAMPDWRHAGAARPAAPAVFAPPAGEGFSRCGGAPMHGGDMLARRAPALQATRRARQDAGAAFHSADMRELGLADGDAVVIEGGGEELRTTAHADDAVAPGAIRFWSPAFAPHSGLTARAAAAAARAE